MSNPSLELGKLLSSFEDPEWENWLLFRAKIESGWTIYLNNREPMSLGSALKWGNQIEGTSGSLRPFKEDECNFFFAIDNTIANIRPYLHKGVIYNYQNDYRVWINDTEHIKPKDQDWLYWTSGIKTPKMSKVTIKEISDPEWNKIIVEKSYLLFPDQYYQFLNQQIISELNFVYLGPLNNYLSNLKVNIKFTNKNKKQFLETFQASQISLNLVLLSLLRQDRTGFLRHGKGSGRLQRFKELQEYRENQLLKFNLLLNKK